MPPANVSDEMWDILAHDMNLKVPYHQGKCRVSPGMDGLHMIAIL